MNFTATEIKKLVYKQKPKAEFVMIRMGTAYYKFDVAVEVAEEENINRIGFECHIPVSDMGTADFLPIMEAKYLLRWVNETVCYFIKTKDLETA